MSTNGKKALGRNLEDIGDEGTYLPVDGNDFSEPVNDKDKAAIAIRTIGNALDSVPQAYHKEIFQTVQALHKIEAKSNKGKFKPLAMFGWLGSK